MRNGEMLFMGISTTIRITQQIIARIPLQSPIGFEVPIGDSFPPGEAMVASIPGGLTLIYLLSIATATSKATFIIWVKAVWRSSAVVSAPIKMWSEMVQMQRPRLP